VPEAPTDLVSSAVTDSEITVTWSQVDGATSYMGYSKTSPDSEWLDYGDLGDVNTVTISDLASDTTYYFTVSAISSSG
jgi:hypothetical protein